MTIESVLLRIIFLSLSLFLYQSHSNIHILWPLIVRLYRIRIWTSFFKTSWFFISFIGFLDSCSFLVPSNCSFYSSRSTNTLWHAHNALKWSFQDAIPNACQHHANTCMFQLFFKYDENKQITVKYLFCRQIN